MLHVEMLLHGSLRWPIYILRSLVSYQNMDMGTKECIWSLFWGFGVPALCEDFNVNRMYYVGVSFSISK